MGPSRALVGPYGVDIHCLVEVATGQVAGELATLELRQPSTCHLSLGGGKGPAVSSLADGRSV